MLVKYIFSQNEAGALQASIFGPWYINDLPKTLSSNVKLFPDHASFSMFVYDAAITTKKLNELLAKVFL